MRIAIFSSYYLPHLGGVEIVVHNLAARLAQRHDVILVTSAWEGKRGRNVENGFEVFRLPAVHAAERWGIPLPLPLGPGVAAAVRAAASADVLAAHGALYPWSWIAARLARRRRLPLVLTEHVGMLPYTNSFLESVQQWAWRNSGDRVVQAAAAVTVVSGRVQDWLARRHPGLQPRFIANGVDTERFTPRGPSERAGIRRRLGLPQDELLVFFVGRDVKRKNLADVLAIPRTGFKIVVCGARRDLKADGIIDLGIIPLDVMPDLFAAVDILIHPSVGEGFPLVVQEGMAAGLPVALLWDDGYAASLDREKVEVASSAAELTTALARLATDPARRAALSAAGREYAIRHWAWDRTVESYERVFAEVVGMASRTISAANAEGIAS